MLNKKLVGFTKRLLGFKSNSKCFVDSFHAGWVNTFIFNTYLITF